MTYIRPTAARRGKFLRARRVNYDEDGIRRAQLVSGDGVLVSQGIDGTSVAFDAAPPTFWIRLLDGDGLGRYAWQEIAGRASAGGAIAWADVAGSAGTLLANGDAAIEANGVGSLGAGTRIEVDREAGSGQVRFQMEACP